jgi:hypothetical protein
VAALAQPQYRCQTICDSIAVFRIAVYQSRIAEAGAPLQR